MGIESLRCGKAGKAGKRAARLLAALGLLWLAACSPVGTAIGVGATAINMATEERGFAGALTDQAIWVDLNGRFLSRDGKLFEKANFQVHEGRVLLSGLVQKPEDRLRALAIARETPGVREVYDELKVGRSLRPDDFAQDYWIASRLRLKLLSDAQVKSKNFSVDCIRSTIYIIGIAQDDRERQRVIDQARDIPYARAVIEYIRLVTDPPPPPPLVPLKPRPPVTKADRSDS